MLIGNISNPTLIKLKKSKYCFKPVTNKYIKESKTVINTKLIFNTIKDHQLTQTIWKPRIQSITIHTLLNLIKTYNINHFTIKIK